MNSNECISSKLRGGKVQNSKCTDSIWMRGSSRTSSFGSTVSTLTEGSEFNRAIASACTGMSIKIFFMILELCVDLPLVEPPRAQRGNPSCPLESENLESRISDLEG